MNEIMESLYQRKSMRAYEDREISEEMKKLILKAASQAPTAGCQQLYTILDITDQKLKEALSEAGLGSFLKTLPKGLDSDVGNAGAALSGGQRQKMGIARALLSEAQYMIFDEATSSVDPQREREIWETIGRLSKTRTLIIISHRMSTIQNANCIYVLEKGVVAQRGSHAELMQQGGLYRELVTRQQAMEVAE